MEHSRTQLPECIARSVGVTRSWCQQLPSPVSWLWSAMLRSQSKILHGMAEGHLRWHEAVQGLVGQLHPPGKHGVIQQWYNMEFEEWSLHFTCNRRTVKRLTEENSSWTGLSKMSTQILIHIFSSHFPAALPLNVIFSNQIWRKLIKWLRLGSQQQLLKFCWFNKEHKLGRNHERQKEQH